MKTSDSERYYFHKGQKIDRIKYHSMFKPNSFELIDEKFKEEVLELKKFKSGNFIDVVSYLKNIKVGDYRYPLLPSFSFKYRDGYLHIKELKDVDDRLYNELIKKEE